jgi:hypothetical protein
MVSDDDTDPSDPALSLTHPGPPPAAANVTPSNEIRTEDLLSGLLEREKDPTRRKPKDEPSTSKPSDAAAYVGPRAVPAARWSDDERPAVIVKSDTGEALPPEIRESPTKPGGVRDPTFVIPTQRTAQLIGVAAALLLVGGVALWFLRPPTPSTPLAPVASPPPVTFSAPQIPPVEPIEPATPEVTSDPIIESQPIEPAPAAHPKPVAHPAASASAKAPDPPKRVAPDDFDNLKKGIVH